ncbi:iron-dicitrate transporter ATP-binding subunit [compost metagenome]
MLKEGRLYQSGTPEDIFTAELIMEVFGIKADVAIHPVTKKTAITYLPASLNR